MAISWGPWEYSGGNGMRVGIDVTWVAGNWSSNIEHGTAGCRAIVDIYTENQYSYSDDQRLDYGGAIGGGKNFHNGSGGARVKRDTVYYEYTYGANEYGSSPGNRTFTASLSGAFNGVTPSKSVTSSIPARPIAAPASPTNVNVSYSGGTATVTWTNHDTAGEPYHNVEVQRWNNVGGWDGVESHLGGYDTEVVNVIDNRQFRWRVRSKNTQGASAWVLSEHLQTPPADPSWAYVEKAGTTSVNVGWSNNASDGYEYTTEIWESQDGGLYTLVEEVSGGTTGATIYGLDPGSLYQYRVRAKSTMDVTTYSSFDYTGTIQLQAGPAAPTGLATEYISDGQISLSWANWPTTEAPYDGLTIQRWSNTTETWETVASLSGSTTSLEDFSVATDRKYQYRIRSNNSAGYSAWNYSAYEYTTPAAPTSVEAEYSGDTTITVTWVNNVSYGDYTISVIPFKNDVPQVPVNLGPGSTSYDLTGIDVLATYHFTVEAISDTSLVSTAGVSNDVQAATPPNAPTNVMPNGAYADLNLDLTFTWVHSKSVDGSSQKKFEVQHRLAGGAWVSSGVITSGVSSWTLPAGTYVNPNSIEVQVRTWGVHPTPGPWSSTATITGSTTPTITLNSPADTIPISAIEVDWDFFDAEGTAQTAYRVTLYDGTGQYVIEQVQGDDATSSLTLETAAEDQTSYILEVQAQDGTGIWSNVLSHAFTSSFMPPAACTLDVTYDEDSGSMVLALAPGTDDGGVTTLPAVAATIERQVWNPATETYDPWEPVIERVDPDATVIDTTAPIHGDGHYRVITYSAAPSSVKSPSPIAPQRIEDKYVYVSGGENFSVVCRLWANVEIGWKASRTKGIHYFAGRSKPVLYSGEHTERVLSVKGLLSGGDSSPPHHWIRLAQQPGPVLLRGPHNRRILGALSEVKTERLGPGLHSVSFSIQEVAR